MKQRSALVLVLIAAAAIPAVVAFDLCADHTKAAEISAQLTGATKTCFDAVVPFLKQIVPYECPAAQQDPGVTSCQPAMALLNVPDGQAMPFTTMTGICAATHESCVDKFFAYNDAGLAAFDFTDCASVFAPNVPAADALAGAIEWRDTRVAHIRGYRLGISFLCSKQPGGDNCGAVFGDAIAQINQCAGGTASCICPALANVGCCARQYTDFADKFHTAIPSKTLSNPSKADVIAEAGKCGYDVPKMQLCASEAQPTTKTSETTMAFTNPALTAASGCTAAEQQVMAYDIQQLVAEQTNVNIAAVAVKITSCAGGAVAKVTIQATDEAQTETASAALATAVSTGTFVVVPAENGSSGSVSLGSFNSAGSTAPKIETQQNQVGLGGSGNSASVGSPSVFVMLALGFALAVIV